MCTIEFFSPPEGDTVTNPPINWLRRLVLSEDENYWNAGAGQGSIKCFRSDGVTTLLLTLHAPLGFYLEYIDKRNTFFVSMERPELGQPVTVYVGGDPLLLPSGCFVSRDKAWAAVAEFYRTGGRATNIQWKKRSELNWEYQSS